MSLTAERTALHLSLFYFIFFSWMGVQIPYFNLHLHHIGLTSIQIGIVAASIPFLRVFSPAIWGHIADRHDRDGTLCFRLWFISTIVFSGLLIADEFGSILITVALFTFFWTPALPMVEAVTVTESIRTGIDYGRIRVWGTAGFIGLSYLTGIILDFSPTIVVIWIMLFFLILNIPVIRHLPAMKGGINRRPAISLISVLKDRRVSSFLTAAMLMQFSHSTYYGFLSIYLDSIGYSRSTIGFLWALGPAGEVIIMLTASRLLRRYGTGSLLLFSLIMAVFRWVLFASFKTVHILIAAQLLHTFTFGTFHIAAVHHVQKIFPENMKNTAQALYSSSSYGIGLVMGTIISGLLYDRFGAPPLFLLSAGAALMALVILHRGKSPRDDSTVSDREVPYTTS